MKRKESSNSNSISPKLCAVIVQSVTIISYCYRTHRTHKYYFTLF